MSLVVNEVNQRRARLVLGWVTVFKTGQASWYVMALYSLIVLMCR